MTRKKSHNKKRKTSGSRVLNGGTIDPRALRFLVGKEIDCGDSLARRRMLAHQHCDLFYPLGWGCDRVYHKLGNAPILRSGTGSWVLSG